MKKNKGVDQKAYYDWKSRLQAHYNESDEIKSENKIFSKKVFLICCTLIIITYSIAVWMTM